MNPRSRGRLMPAYDPVRNAAYEAEACRGSLAETTRTRRQKPVQPVALSKSNFPPRIPQGTAYKVAHDYHSREAKDGFDEDPTRNLWRMVDSQMIRWDQKLIVQRLAIPPCLTRGSLHWNRPVGSICYKLNLSNVFKSNRKHVFQPVTLRQFLVADQVERKGLRLVIRRNCSTCIPTSAS
jgi:hypothetical protein